MSKGWPPECVTRHFGNFPHLGLWIVSVHDWRRGWTLPDRERGRVLFTKVAVQNLRRAGYDKIGLNRPAPGAGVAEFSLDELLGSVKT